MMAGKKKPALKVLTLHIQRALFQGSMLVTKKCAALSECCMLLHIYVKGTETESSCAFKPAAEAVTAPKQQLCERVRRHSMTSRARHRYERCENLSEDSEGSWQRRDLLSASV